MAGKDSPVEQPHQAPSDTSPRVSVIIPTYNRSQLLRTAIDSVLTQTYPAIETIVVDDGSTDDTDSVMAQYAGRVTYIKQANQGVEAARNRGIRAASGEYLSFLDDDDLFMPAKLGRQVHVLDTRPEIGLVHCGYYHIDKDGNPLEKVSFLPDGILRDLVCTNLIWSGAPLIRRQCLEQVGLFDEDTWGSSADWDMWLRIAQAGYPFACVREPLGAYRIQPDSMMSNVRKLEHGVFAVLDKVFADPQLPADVTAVKDQAYGGIHLWISWRYYAAGHWDDAQRNLTDALALCPHLVEHPEHLLQHLCNDALSVRISDPVKFLKDVFNHWPPNADSLHRYHSQALGHIYVGLALKNYGAGDTANAKRQLAEAIALDPAILKQGDDFAAALCRYAMRLPVDVPLAYADTVFQNLPAVAQSLERMRSHVLSEVSLGCGFEDYYAGRRWLVARHVLTALRYRPSWLTNRGALSILLKSLPELLTTQCHQIT
jgi:glycosyltransferase involved in cell wall biosynthesis